MFFSPNVNIPATGSPLSQTWVYQIVVQGILAGNSIYDSVTSIPRTFGVLEALQTSSVLNNIIGNTTVGPELPVSIVPETNPTASLPYYWRQALAKGRTTSVFILRSNTVVFIPTTQGVFLLDSHFHGNSGAQVAFTEWQHSFELLSWYKKINGFQYTLGTQRIRGCKLSLLQKLTDLKMTINLNCTLLRAQNPKKKPQTHAHEHLLPGPHVLSVTN